VYEGGPVPYSGDKLGIAYSEDGINWVKDPDNPILGGIYAEEPALVLKDGVYYLWFEDEDWDTELAIGTDLKDMQILGKVLVKGASSEWDSSLAEAVSPVYDGSEWKIYYHGRTDSDTKIGLAFLSGLDAKVWSVIEGREFEAKEGLLHIFASSAGVRLSTKSTIMQPPYAFRVVGWELIAIGNNQIWGGSDAQGPTTNNGARIDFYDDASGGGGTDRLYFDLYSGGTKEAYYNQPISETLPFVVKNIELRVNSSGIVKAYKNDEYLAESTSGLDPATPLYIVIDALVDRGDSEYKIDCMLVRNYVEPEPSVTVGAEETA